MFMRRDGLDMSPKLEQYIPPHKREGDSSTYIMI